MCYVYEVHQIVPGWEHLMFLLSLFSRDSLKEEAIIFNFQVQIVLLTFSKYMNL